MKLLILIMVPKDFTLSRDFLLEGPRVTGLHGLDFYGLVVVIEYLSNDQNFCSASAWPELKYKILAQPDPLFFPFRPESLRFK